MKKKQIPRYARNDNLGVARAGLVANGPRGHDKSCPYKMEGNPRLLWHEQFGVVRDFLMLVPRSGPSQRIPRSEAGKADSSLRSE
jgi:hypothetical protein